MQHSVGAFVLSAAQVFLLTVPAHRMMSCTDADLPRHLSNKEACGLEVNLLIQEEMGGEDEVTLLKREDQRGQEADCPVA